VGLDQGDKAIKKKFLEQSKTVEMSDRVRHAFTALGVFGHLARMVVFALIGYFLIKAALDYDPHNAVGLDGALAKLAHASYGPVLLGAVASHRPSMRSPATDTRVATGSDRRRLAIVHVGTRRRYVRARSDVRE
jgi:Domain of Unknown Function (DUF1206)